MIVGTPSPPLPSGVAVKTELLSIGSELTSGQNLDTNSQWLSRRLAEIGIPVGWHTTVADDLEDNVQAFRVATNRASLVIATGGLGPTQDDLTREALARLAGVDLVFHQPSFDYIRELFAQRRRHMPDKNRVQAMFPTGAEPILNDRGTAPGIWMSVGGCQVVAMPGVPSEMFHMFETKVKPRLLHQGLSGGVLIQRKINCFGAGESALEEKLLDLTRRGQVPEVGITVSDATISLRIVARGLDREAAQAQIAPVEETIRQRLGDLVFGTDEEELQDAVVRVLGEKHRTLAVAESVTGGMLAEHIVAVPGSSGCFLGGIISYDNRIKSTLLGVPAPLIAEHGAVSDEVVRAMAEGCRARLQSDYALSTVGLAGPGGATQDKPIGLVFVGLSWEGGMVSHRFSWSGTRDEIRSRTTKLALNTLRLHLLKSSRREASA
jgi:nicotinamide-nucleotide amidase